MTGMLTRDARPLLRMLPTLLLLATPCLATSQASAAACQATTMDDLFPHTRPDALNITRNLFNAVATNYSLLVPSPTAGFTLFASADTAYTSRQRARAQAVQTMLDSQPEQLVTWVLYSFAYVPLSQVDITIAPIATELQARTLNTSYVLSAQGMPPSLTVQDLLSPNPQAGQVTVLDSYQVCSSYVYILDSLIWPSSDPTTIPNTDLTQSLPQIWPGASPISFTQAASPEEQRAQLLAIIDSLLNLAPGVDPTTRLQAQITSPNPQTQPGPGPQPPKPSPTAAIVGGVVGGVGGAVLLAGAAWVLARKVYRKPPLETISSNPPTQDPESGKMKGWTDMTAHAWGKPQADSARSMNGNSFHREGSDRVPEVEMIDWDMSPEAITICQAPDGSDRLWELGSGGFGIVYKAMLDSATPVAVKFVTNQSPKEQDRFKREVAILKSLRHVNIVQFLGAAMAGDKIMLVTEFMPRGDLWRALAQDRTGQMGWYNRGRGIALDVVRGVLHMHARRIIHLDLKTANILLARDGKAKVADVGLARVLTREHTAVSMDGTFDWSAPEVLAGQQCSEAADIWSLAVVLWEIVSGERPHMRQMRPIRVPEECPAEVRDLIQHCLSLEPSQRPTAMQVYDRLHNSQKAPLADQEALVSQRSSPADPAHRSSSSSDTHSRPSQPSSGTSRQQEGASPSGMLDDLPFGYMSPFAQQGPHSGQVTAASMLKSNALQTRRSRARQESMGLSQPAASRLSSHLSANSVGTPQFGYVSPFQQVANQGWAPSTQPSGQSSRRTVR